MEVFVTLCTLTNGDEFRENATLAYLAARKLEKVMNIWIEEMSGEEHVLFQVQDSGSDTTSISSSRKRMCSRLSMRIRMSGLASTCLQNSMLMAFYSLQAEALSRKTTLKRPVLRSARRIYLTYGCSSPS